MALSAKQVAEKVTDLQQANQTQLASRARTRILMNGGPAAMAILLGKSATTHELSIANMFESNNAKLAQKIGRMPTLKVDPPIKAYSKDRTTSERARDAADKRARILTGYDTYSPRELQAPQAARWQTGYGFCTWVIRTHRSPEGHPYPLAELRDPFNCFPGDWGHDQQPAEMAYLYRMSTAKLRQAFPDWKGPPAPGISAMGSTVASYSSWLSQSGGGHLIAEYYNADGVYVIEVESEKMLSYSPNPKGFHGTRFVVAKRYSFDQLTGAWDSSVGLAAMMAKLNILGYQAMEDAVNTETNVFGDQYETTYKRGRGAVNTFATGAHVDKPIANLPYQLFNHIDRIERQLRIEGSYPASQDSEAAQGGFITGAGQDALLTPLTEEIAEYHKSLRFAHELIDYKLLNWDDVLNPDESRPIVGVMGGEPFAENYKPSVDIAGQYSTRRIYGAMAGWDDQRKIIVGLQLQGAEVIDIETLQENIDGLENIGLINQRIRKRKMEDVLVGGLQQSVAEKDPRATMAAFEVWQRPAAFDEVMTKYFTPEEPQLSPEEAALAQGPQGPGGPPPGDIGTAFQSVLSRAQLGGGVEGGVQTVDTRRT